MKPSKSNPDRKQAMQSLTRRHFFGRGATGIGVAALAGLLNREADGTETAGLHFEPRVKRVIHIVKAGGPAQMELYDHKPKLKEMHGKELPPSVRKTQRLTGFTSGQGEYPIVNGAHKFKRYGRSGTMLSELLPHMGDVVDELCFVKSVHTEAVNHDPAVTFITTGTQQPGRPSIGAWLSYGIGSENSQLPAFVVLLTPGLIQDASTPLSSRHWGSGFLSSTHQGVKFRGSKDPVLYLSNPPGIDRSTRREMLDATSQLNRLREPIVGRKEIGSQIARYEMAFEMQMSVPRLTNLAAETKSTLNSYGPLVRQPGTYAANCLLARRLVEAGVRFVQIFDRDWDHHRNAPAHMKTKCQWFDQPTAALIRDLKQRGLLDDTLVVCGGEFGRTAYCQGPLQKNYGRDHHGGCFTMWFAGGGLRGGFSYGKTDPFSYTVEENPVHVHDIHATILHLLGIDHKKLTHLFQSREFRLTDIAGRVVKELWT